MEVIGSPNLTGPGGRTATLPAVGVPQPTAAQKAAVEDKWNDPVRIMQQVLEVLAREGKPAADDLLHWVNTHRK